MRHKIIFHLLLCLLFSSSASLYASDPNTFEASNRPKFSGTILNYSMGDSVYIIFTDDGINCGVSTHDILDFYIRADSSGYFEFSLPNWGQISHLTLSLKKPNRRSNFLGDYLVEMTDSINVVIHKERDTLFTTFSGMGSAKYQCTDQLEDILFYKADRHNLYRSRYSSSPNWLDSLIEYYNVPKNLNYNTLNKYKSIISPAVSELLRAEKDAGFNKQIMFFVQRLLFSDDDKVDPDFKSELILKYSSKYQSIRSVAKNQDLEKSAILREYALKKTKTDLSIKYGKLSSMNEVLEEISKIYSGVVLDKLIAELLFGDLIDFTRNDQSDSAMLSCFNRAFQLEHIPIVKNSIKSRVRMVKGNVVPDFSMIDTSGKIVRLSDFKNKVVILDFWFTGCGGCALFYRRLKDSIEPRFKSERELEIISICLDKSREKWMSSLYKNMYTDPEHINLFARSSDFSCELMKYYCVTGAPFTLLIGKNGRLITATDAAFKENDNDLKYIIYAALREGS